MSKSENKNVSSGEKANAKKFNDKAPTGGVIGENTRCHQLLTFPTRGGGVIKISDNPPLARYQATRRIYDVLPQAYDIIQGDSDHLLVLPDGDPTNYDVMNALTNIMEEHITRFFIDAIVNCLDYGHHDCGCGCDCESDDPMDLLHDDLEDNTDDLKVGTIEQPTPVSFNNCHIGNLYINEKKAKNKGGDVDQSYTDIWDNDDDDDDDYEWDYPCSGDCANCDGFSMCGEDHPMSDSERGNIIHAILANITPERLDELRHILDGGFTSKKTSQCEDEDGDK